MKLILILLLSAPLLASCEDKTKIMQALEKATADKGCDTDADCAFVGVGSRSCGGPDGFLVYSQRQAKKADVEKWAAKHAALDKEGKKGMASICSVEEPPLVACVSGQCVRRPALELK